MSNPYYPHKTHRNSPGYNNPLAIPYSESHQYPPSSSAANVVGPYQSDPYGYPDRLHAGTGPQSSPYYSPYNNLSSANIDPQALNASSEHLVTGGAYGRNPHKPPTSRYGQASSDEEDALALPYQPFARGYGDRGPGGVQPPPRPDSPFDGVYLDRPPVYKKLNAEQREIFNQFPKDLDDQDGGKTGIQAVKGMLRNWKKAFKLRYLHWWIITIVLGVAAALFIIYHTQIVDWLTPISKKVNSVSWGWTIPVAILFVISFPPLFGHEIVLLLCGIVYGMWIGFGIATLGTLLGEIGNFYAFKYCLQGRAAKYERKNVHYACMAQMVRDGGFWVMFLARLSAIPGHFTTAIFATVGMNIFIFTLAAILAMPKQLVIVYFGVAIQQSGSGDESTTSKIIKYVIVAISIIITIWTAHWLYKKMEKIRPDVQAKLRQRRYDQLMAARNVGPTSGGQTTINLNPAEVEDKDGYELEMRRSHQSDWNERRNDDRYPPHQDWQTQQVDYHGDNRMSAYPSPSRPQQQQPGSPDHPNPGPIQFHKPMRQHSQEPATPPVGAGGYHEDSDLSQVRLRSPTQDVHPSGRPQIRVDTRMRGDYQYASEIGSVYQLGSEVTSAGARGPTFQPSQIVLPTGTLYHGTPVAALQSYQSPTTDAPPAYVPDQVTRYELSDGPTRY